MTNHSVPKKQSSSSTIVPLSVLIGAATSPLLIALVGGKLMSKAVQELGQLSEEFFRGDRLPLLKLPTPPIQSTQSTDTCDTD